MNWKASPGLSIDYIIAAPRWRSHVKYSTQIYNIYLNYGSKDIHVYSIDEVNYGMLQTIWILLPAYFSSRHEMILDVLKIRESRIPPVSEQIYIYVKLPWTL